MNAYLGIDPGKQGAAALYIPRTKRLDFYDWRDELTALGVLVSWRDHNRIAGAILERPPIISQGKFGIAKLHRNYGVWRGLLVATRIPFAALYPREWQARALNKTKGQTAKQAAWEGARELFPGVFAHQSRENGRADAVLMAWLASQPEF